MIQAKGHGCGSRSSEAQKIPAPLAVRTKPALEHKGRFKRNDPRIWKHGRPKTFDALRTLAQEIAKETALDDDGKPILEQGHAITVVENILRGWARSPSAVLQQSFIQVAYGKLPDTTVGCDGSSNQQVIVVVGIDTGRI